jgi:hypothetical protein
VDSPDGTSIGPPSPPPSFTANGEQWSIDTANWVCRNGARTNGHAMQVAWINGSIWAKSPDLAKHFNVYEWLGANHWRDTGSATMPIINQRIPIVEVGGQTRINVSNGPTNTVYADLLLGAAWTQTGGDWLDKNGLFNGPTPFASQVVPSAGPVTFNIAGIGGDIIVKGMQKSSALPTIDGVNADAFEVGPSSGFSIAIGGSDQFNTLFVRNPSLGSTLVLFLNSNQSCTVSIYHTVGPLILDYPFIGASVTPNIYDLDITSQQAVFDASIARGGDMQGGLGVDGWVYSPEYLTDSANGNMHYLRCASAPGNANQRIITVQIPFAARNDIWTRACYWLEDDIQTGFNPAALGMKLTGPKVTNSPSGGTVAHIFEYSQPSLPNNPNVYGLRLYRYDINGDQAWTWLGNVFMRTNRWYSLEMYTNLGTFGNADGQISCYVNGHQVYSETRSMKKAAGDLYDDNQWQLYHGGLALPLGIMHHRCARVGTSTNYMGPPAELAPAATTYPTWRSTNLIKDTWGACSSSVPTGSLAFAFDDWGGAAAINGKVYAGVTGAHGGNTVNDFWCLDCNQNAPAWAQVNPGSPPAQFKPEYPYYLDSNGLPRGLPGTRHTYFSLQPLPGLAGSNPNVADGGAHDRILLGPGGPLEIGHTPDENVDTCFLDAFDTVTNTWDLWHSWARTNNGNNAFGSPCTIHPTTHDLWIWDGAFGSPNTGRTWTRSTNIWSVFSINGVGANTFSASFIDGPRNKWFLTSSTSEQAFTVVDLNTMIATQHSVSGLGASFPLDNNYNMFVHDSFNDRYLLAGCWRDSSQGNISRQSLYAVDPITFAATYLSELPGNNLIDVYPNPEIIMGKFAFHQGLKCMTWTPGKLDGTFFMPLVNG